VTRIIIEGLQDRASLLSALSVVLDVFNHEDSYRQTEHVFVPDESPEPQPWPTSTPVERPTLMPFTPCPERGRHQRLVECWMCWCDVMRGAALEPEVLAPAAWWRPNS
jgi:hypothetical protein